MSKFMQKTLLKLDKVDRDQIASLLNQLSLENESLRIVMDSLTDGVLVTDTEGRLSLVNKSADRLLPLSPGETRNRPIWDVVSDPDVAAFCRSAIANKEKVADREFTLTNGRTMTLAFSIFPLVRKGRIEGNVVHVENVTEKRVEQARLRRAESLAALTTLTAGVAHEIKNPLQSIGIHIQLIEKLLQGKRSIKKGEIEPYLKVINEEVDRLNRIVVDFLFAVRPMDARPVKSDLNNVVRELMEFMRYELEQAHVRTELLLAGNLPTMELDERLMKQALLNMVQNAVSAMPDGGTLRIETAREGNEVHLRIGDSGVGIPEGNLAKIWEPFFTTKDFGSGLGLTVVFKIVKAHRGDITVQSQLGEGTTFTVTLPVPQVELTLLESPGGAEAGSDGR